MTKLGVFSILKKVIKCNFDVTVRTILLTPVFSIDITFLLYKTEIKLYFKFFLIVKCSCTQRKIYIYGILGNYISSRTQIGKKL